MNPLVVAPAIGLCLGIALVAIILRHRGRRWGR